MQQYEGVIYGAYSKYTRLRIRYVVQPNIEYNHSGISLYLYAERTKNSHQYNNNNNQAYWSLNGTGNTYAKFDWSASSSELFLGSTTIVVDHNPDGTGAVTLSGYWYTGRTGSNYIPEALSVSEQITLQTIPRASSVNGGSGNIGETTTISVSRASTSFTHTLRYLFGTLSGTIATGVGTSYTWTIPTSFYAQIPNDKTGVGTIYCDTYSGSTLVGTKSTTFTATVTETSSRPTVSATLTDTNSTTKALTGNASKMVRGKSTGQLVITSAVKNSATIKSVTVNGTNVGTAASITKTYANIATSSFTIVTTDSRGFVNTSCVLNPSYVDYVPLTLSATIFRPQPTGTEIQMTYSGNYFNGSFGAVANTLSITWKYKEKGASSWINGGTITPTLSGNTISSKTISLGTSYSYQKSYDFQITSVDKLTTSTQTISISMGTPVFHWGKNFFHVSGGFTVNGTAETGNIPISAGLEGISFNDVAVGGTLYKSGLHSAMVDGSWYNLINIRHRNGQADGTKYGMQIMSPMTTVYPSMSVRQNHNGSWGGWFAIPIATTLFDNMTGVRGTVTLNVSAANFSTLEIFYGTSDSNYNISTRIAYPNGKRCRISWVGGSYLYYKDITINGTSITNYSFIRISYVDGSRNDTEDEANMLYIKKVVGYR